MNRFACFQCQFQLKASCFDNSTGSHFTFFMASGNTDMCLPKHELKQVLRRTKKEAGGLTTLLFVESISAIRFAVLSWIFGSTSGQDKRIMLHSTATFSRRLLTSARIRSNSIPIQIYIYISLSLSQCKDILQSDVEKSNWNIRTLQVAQRSTHTRTVTSFFFQSDGVQAVRPTYTRRYDTLKRLAHQTWRKLQRRR